MLARKNATVYIAAKDTEKTKRAIQDVKSRLRKDKGVKCTESEINARVLHHTLDFSEISSVIESAKDFIRHCERLDILIINTAVKCDGSAVGKLTPDGYESSFEELYLGPFAFLTEALPLVERTSKDYGDARIVVMVPNEYRESKTIDFEDLEEEWKQFCGFVRDGYNLKLKDRFYERSKLAALLSSKAMDEKLRERGILNVFTNICYSSKSGLLAQYIEFVLTRFKRHRIQSDGYVT